MTARTQIKTETRKQNRYGTWMEIFNEVDEQHVLIYLPEHDYQMVVTKAAWDSGGAKTPYDKASQGVGYLGVGKYRASVNGEKTPQYRCWYEMIRRCYSTWAEKHYPAYLGCTVAPEWHCLQNFGAWYNENYYQIDNMQMCLDKDLLHKGNKIYSPENCIFLPAEINKFIEFQSAKKDNGLPIGVRYYKDRYCAWCLKDGKAKSLGCYWTVEEAWQAYRIWKQTQIKNFANKFKKKMPERVFNALMNYEVTID